jgi:malate dehydrogenase (oxaloacetate-decarboxylating)
MDFSAESLRRHAELKGKLSVSPTMPLFNRDDLSIAYTPGVASPCLEIARNPPDVFKYTIKSHTIAVVTDGSAVLGLGNIGAKASLPVMEGKCALFKRFGGLDAFPIALDTQNDDEIVSTVQAIAPVFGGINLEDIAAPRCVGIEERLIESLDIPVFHDDQHGTAIVVLAGLLNALKVVQKDITTCRIVILGAGAAGSGIARLLHRYGVGEIIMADSKGVIGHNRTDLTDLKTTFLLFTNRSRTASMLYDAMVGADVFIGVSRAGTVQPEMVRVMAKDAIVFALANPLPEIMPDQARAAGAVVVATGRSDFGNQLNNALVFPGVFRGALECGARKITPRMKIAAAEALASLVPHPTADRIIPSIFESGVMEAVAGAIRMVRERDRIMRETMRTG